MLMSVMHSSTGRCQQFLAGRLTRRPDLVNSGGVDVVDGGRGGWGDRRPSTLPDAGPASVCGGGVTIAWSRRSFLRKR